MPFQSTLPETLLLEEESEKCLRWEAKNMEQRYSPNSQLRGATSFRSGRTCNTRNTYGVYGFGNLVWHITRTHDEFP